MMTLYSYTVMVGKTKKIILKNGNRSPRVTISDVIKPMKDFFC